MAASLTSLLLVLSAFFGSGLALKCYECNVWKAGYGHLCDNPRIRTDCSVCMKIQTSIFIGYYKNTPRNSIITTRICGNEATTHFSHECHHYTMVDGSSTRCYCDADLCNGAPSAGPPTTLLGVVTGVAVVLLTYRVLL